MAANRRFFQDDVLGFFDDYECESMSEESDCDLDTCETTCEDFDVIRSTPAALSCSLSTVQESVSSNSPSSCDNNNNITNSNQLNLDLQAANSTTVSQASTSNDSSTHVANVNHADIVPTDPEFGCKCSRKCYSLYTIDSIEITKLEMMELTTKEKDLVIMAKLQALTTLDPMTSDNKAIPHARQRPHTRYFHHGHEVCRKFFENIHCVGKDRLGNLMTHLKNEGLTIRRKKSGGRKANTRALSHETTNGIFSFLYNYAEEHAIKLPGRIPGFKDFKLSLLPSELTKERVYDKYQLSLGVDDRKVALTTFKNIWRSLLPYIVINRPATDLCWTCQKNNTIISR